MTDRAPRLGFGHRKADQRCRERPRTARVRTVGELIHQVRGAVCDGLSLTREHLATPLGEPRPATHTQMQDL